MIDVQMNLDAYGLGTRISQLANIKIWNDGTGTKNKGNYGYQIRGKDNRILKEGKILNHNRLSETAIKLLQKVINDAYPPKETKAKTS